MDTADLIKSAFQSVVYPGDTKIVHCTCPECEEIAAFFSRKTWLDCQSAELQQQQSAISLFSAEALHYFLPAFMLWSRTHWRESDNIPWSITFQFLPVEDTKDESSVRYRRERTSIFTTAQREAIAAYLREYRLSEDAAPYVDDVELAISALLSTDSYPFEGKPNQALLPTPMSITDRADARSAPDTGAADL